MKKYLWLITVVFIIVIVIGISIYWQSRKASSVNKQVTPLPLSSATIIPSASSSKITSQAFAFPIKNYFANQTKKVFGQYITPATSPIQPERFQGYHTGVDIEVSSEDLTQDVPIYSIGDGTVLEAKWASGYGGVMVIEYQYNNMTMTAIYGHLRISSVTKRAGDKVSKAEQIGVLGTGYSQETDGERRHLHFSIHKGSSIVILGYVQNRADLSNWLDPNSLFK